MKGHVLMDAEIIDTEAYAEFAKKSPEAVAAHGGRVLVRTSDIEAIQRDWMPKRLVVLEFGQPRSGEGEHRLGRVYADPRRPPPPCDEGPHRGRREFRSLGVSSGLARYADGTMRPGPHGRIESTLDRKGSHEALTNGQVDR